MMLTSLAVICRAAGLKVVEVDGWKTRGHGPLDAVKTIICHHTAGPPDGNMPSLGTITNGRPGLAGPLSQLGLARDGTVYVIAAGLAYHAGASLDPSYTNANSIGIEAEATGVDPWPEAQMAAYVRVAAALCDAYGLSAARVLGHKEAAAPAGRKPDPNFGMSAFRTRVKAEIPKIKEAPPVALTDAEISRIADAVLGAPIVQAWDGRTVSVRTLLSSAHYYTLSGAVAGAVPDGATSGPGRPTALATTLARIAALPAPVVPPPVDVDALAVALAAKLPTLPGDAVKAAIREVLGSLDGAVPPSSAGS